MYRSSLVKYTGLIRHASVAGMRVSCGRACCECGSTSTAVAELLLAARRFRFIDLDDSASVWPAGKVVVLEGFVGSVQQDERSTQFSVKVCARLLDGSRSLPTPRTASHSPPCQCPRSTCAPRAVPLQQLTKHSITLPGSLCAHRPAVHISCTAIAVSRCA